MGRGSLVFKVLDSCPASHKFEPSAAEDHRVEGAMYVKSVKAQTSSRWCGMKPDCVFPYPIRHKTDHLNGTSAHAPQHPMVTYTGNCTVGPGPYGLLRH
ncbi:hypothetical protein TNCV_3025171 [Trichonephila clavipes]|nr:hypothetical protein TNCV_3025171 [Trichonephila clavipes]